MKITCNISGEELYKSDLTLGFNLSDVHPIFRANKKLILTPDTVWKFQKSASLREKKLYFLAVVNSMDLVDFRVPANPAPYVMEHSFYDACTLATWVDYARANRPLGSHPEDRITFPRYVVGPDNREMLNLPIWLGSLFEIRQMFLDNTKEDDRKRDLNSRVQEIEREFRKAGLLGRAFTRPLAKWALDLTDTTEGVYNSWLAVLETPLEDAWMLDKETVLEIQEHLQSNLPVTNDQAIAVLHQVNKLVEECRQGFSQILPDSTFQFDAEGNQKLTSHQIQHQLEDGIERVVVDESLVPTVVELPPQPMRSEFPKMHLYLQAKAKWDLACQKILHPNRQEFRKF